MIASLRILIIDNDADQISAVRKAFDFGQDAIIEEALKSSDAIEKIHRNPYDIIFLDLMLAKGTFAPAINILDAINNTRSHGHGLVFIITNYANDIKYDPRLKEQLRKYSLICEPITPQSLESLTEERRFIQNWINEFIKLIDRRTKDFTSTTADDSPYNRIGNLLYFVLFSSLLLSGWFVVAPYIRKSFPSINDSNSILIGSLPGIIFVILFFWDKTKESANLALEWLKLKGKN